MGKKRAKDRTRSPKEDSSADLTGVTCTHIRKGTDPSWMRKTSLDKSWDTCEVCEQKEETEDGQDAPAIWMCLKCGHRGCGRYSENQHAVKHYETPRSDPHCLVLSLDNWSVWCYICDDNIYFSKTGQLAQLISSIKKQVLGESRQKAATRTAKEEKDTSSDAVQETEGEEEEEKKEEPKENKKCVKQNGEETQSTTVPVRGLSNLGNTCFFNAVLQNLSQTWLLRQLLGDFRDEEKSMLIKPSSSSELDPLQVQLPRPGSLTLAMCQLLNEIQENKKGVVTPRELFTQVCKKAARFKGFQQQDSQELLRYLLDGMRAEESNRMTAGILNALKCAGKNSEPEQKKLVKEYESNGGTKSFVEHVFGGELTSTVMCTECKTVSVVTEMFLDLSLPVADEAYRKKKGGGQQKKSIESIESGRDVETPLTNGNEDMPTGMGSKYQQKKAKKQAKKQAKTQRRQQKQGAKLTLDVLTSQNNDASPEAPPPSTNEAETEGGTNELVTQSEPAEQNQEMPAEEEEEVEDDEEAQNSASNRFISLSEEGTEKQEVEEEDDHEEEKLTKSVRALSIAEEHQSKEVESGAGSDPETEAEPGFVVVNTDPKAAFLTLSTRAAPESSESSVDSCLYQFTQVEQLTHTNSLLCVTCSRKGGKKKVYTEAMKQMLISSPPPVLTLHLKRFQQTGYSVCKVNRHVQFPQVLDLGPFCSTKCKGVEEGQTQLLYSLYGIVEHSGTMRSGHYTAFVKTRPHTHTSSGLLNGAAGDEAAGDEASKGSWFYISDSNVQPVTEARVQTSQAYLLFYERIS